jgi:hypothetical protein
MKTIKVTLNARWGSCHTWSDGSDIDVSEAGVATVTGPDGSVTAIYSPKGWQRVEIQERQ